MFGCLRLGSLNTNSEIKISVQKVYWEMLLGPTPKLNFTRPWNSIEGIYTEKSCDSELYLGRLIWLRCLDWIKGGEIGDREDSGKLFK